MRQLEPKSFRLLQFLIENHGRIVTKDEILRAVWDDVAVTDNALTRAIAQLRKALDEDPKAPRFIATGETKTIINTGFPDLGLAISPDGRYLLFEQVDYFASDLMLFEGFR